MSSRASARAARPTRPGAFIPTLGRRCALALVSLVTAGTALADTFLSYDFESTATTWPAARYYGRGASGSLPYGNGGINNGNGTIDTYNSATRGKSLRVTFAAPNPSTAGYWFAGGGSGKFLNPNNLNGFSDSRLLNLSFDYRGTSPNPVRLRITSFDTNSWNAPDTNYVEFLVVPPVANAYKRFSFDLSSPFNASGTFNPRAAYLEITVNAQQVGDGTLKWPEATHSMEIDNVSLSRPSFYVDSSSTATQLGTASNPYKTLQQAVNAAQAGDVIVVRQGSGYDGAPWDQESQSAFVANARFKGKMGTPAKWIVLRNYPGETPVLRPREDSSGAIAINHKGCAYIEIRGMTVVGWAAEINSPQGYTYQNVTYTKQGAIDNSTYANGSRPYPIQLYNSSGITFPSVGEGILTHHIRLINNTVRYTTAGGIGGDGVDYVTMEGNSVSYAANHTRYGSSGLGLLTPRNFTSVPEFRMYFLGNESFNNESLAFYQAKNSNGEDTGTNNISDGNGIIADRFKDSSYTGKTLIQNNVVSGNGSAGIQAYKSRGVTIINNTAARNAEGPAQLSAKQIDLTDSINCVVVNNILNPWLDAGMTTAQRNATSTVRPSRVGGVGGLAEGNTVGFNLSFRNGGPTEAAQPSVVNGSVESTTTNLYGDPLFEGPYAGGDYNLKDGSAALDRGNLNALGAPRVDFDGMPRPQGNLQKIDIGAHEK